MAVNGLYFQTRSSDIMGGRLFGFCFKDLKRSFIEIPDTDMLKSVSVEAQTLLFPLGFSGLALLSCFNTCGPDGSEQFTNSVTVSHSVLLGTCNLFIVALQN